MTPQIASLMAHYNRWMNDRVFAAAATLDAATLAADKGAFFGSILGTLNHVAVADTIWLHRFAWHGPSSSGLGALAGFPRPTSLTQSLAQDLAGLRGYRRDLDDLIEQWAAELTPGHLSAPLTYVNMAGVESSRSFGALLQHFFNHQTHHRGQVSTLLFQSGVDVGVTDLLAVIPRGDDRSIAATSGGTGSCTRVRAGRRAGSLPCPPGAQVTPGGAIPCHRWTGRRT